MTNTPTDNTNIETFIADPNDITIATGDNLDTGFNNHILNTLPTTIVDATVSKWFPTSKILN